MPVAVNYRVKSGPGPLLTAIGEPPFNITGLTNGITYEVQRPDGTWAEVTPGVQGLARTASTTIINTSATQTVYDSNALVPNGITAADGNNRLLVLCVAFMANGASSTPVVGATLGGQAFTSLGRYPTNNAPMEILYIKETDIPAGANAVTITAAGNGGRACLAHLLEYQGIDQVAPFGTLASNFGLTQAVTTTADNNLTLRFMATRGNGNTHSPTTIDGDAAMLLSAETGIVAYNDVTMALAEESIPTASSVSRTFTTAAAVNGPWSLGVELRAA